MTVRVRDGQKRGHNPLLGIDVERLEAEMSAYQRWLDERADEAYAVAEKARSLGYDHKEFVEIPRAADLAGRTEKLLVEYLDGYEVADDIRLMLAENDRETTSMIMAQRVARGFRDKGYDLITAIDVGLRVGLAILTEAVLVAPLEGISEVRLLNNVDGSQFVSVHFAGPIRAAGGTAQALAVLIADMIRRELNIGHYQPTDPEVERVKEEFGLYRGNLQYRPPPEEIDEIVRACPIMINGESTEKIECSGYGRVRNIDEPRIRGGVLLVIGEGMCLKAPKIQKHTERLNVPGWDFISKFASKGKEDDGDGGGPSFKSRKVPVINKFMKDIIAGRPVFGAPLQPGGFRLRYGRARPSGLAAASTNTASMLAMDDFITIGTQMKIERPGKACAITPSDDTDGPWVVLRDGRFLRLDDAQSYTAVRKKVGSVWDNGELVLGYGEFMENNKKLVPAGYSIDWWASDLLEELNSSSAVKAFLEIFPELKEVLPDGVPGIQPEDADDPDAQFHTRRKWHRFLTTVPMNWQQGKATAVRFKTSLTPPHNPWFRDLPIEWVPPFLDIIEGAAIEPLGSQTGDEEGLVAKPLQEQRQLRIVDGVKNWNQATMDILQPELIERFEDFDIPGLDAKPVAPVFATEVPEAWAYVQHGLAKGAAMILGLRHHHDGNDLVITSGWPAVLEGFGFSFEGAKPLRIVDAKARFEARIEQLRTCHATLNAERQRQVELSKARATVRIAAETDARQRGLGISETDVVGRQAVEKVEDKGPVDPDEYLAAQLHEDDHAVDGILLQVRKISDLRWEHAAPVRIGCRMGRPEKAAPRIMNPMTHALFPIDLNGGNQRLLANAAQKQSIRVQMGKRLCKRCGRESPFILCHHKDTGNVSVSGAPLACGGRTAMRPTENTQRRRRGEIQTVRLDTMIEDARVRLGMDRLPRQVKCMKKIASRDQTPEAIEKGLLRAKYELPVFRDGTVRYDMSDVPVTHFTPREIDVTWQQLHSLGYTHDCDGVPLTHNEQMLELFPQDFIVAKSAGEFFVRTAKFIDDLLVRYYDMEPYYNVDTPDDLVGHLICALAPHTSGGVLSRIIGWADCSGGYAHPLFHAAKRRNCDGDEDAIMLLMDGLLNFSREILPANRGGLMDAPLVLTTRLNPTEVDKEALNVDSGWFYTRDFYEATQSQVHPKECAERMDFVERRLGSVAAVRGYGYTHGCNSLDEGPAFSAYKTLDTMIDKMNGQLDLGHRLRGVNVRTVASSVVRSHFLPDLRGNLNAYARQKVRCLKCGHSYRRMPVSGNCIQPKKETGRGLASVGVAKTEGGLCQGNLALTVSEGAVRKYIKVTKHVMATYGVDNYTKQNVEWLSDSADSLFNNDRARQLSLSDFL
ncbi:MAG: hypothetical protein CMA63_00085 [Euryarchaeota archaeon]|nr:hypothetical protein [Euryarchaeota archaeon]